jgi:hypothetical protein
MASHSSSSGAARRPCAPTWLRISRPSCSLVEELLMLSKMRGLAS